VPEDPPESEATAVPVTILLSQWKDGDASALDQLTPLIYSELRRLASSRLRLERREHTLQPTALVHEAFLKLATPGVASVDWENRNHFFAIAARLMRQILIQYARAHRAEKRGGGAPLICLEDAGPLANTANGQADNLLEIDAALEKLEAIDARKARVVELRYFGGLTVPEIASTIAISTATVERDLRSALAWLRREMTDEESMQ
jgi:RNA polymerase sigma-70 factor, ECF subfamily